MPTYYKKTERAKKMEELAKKVPAPLSWVMPDTRNPASYMFPIGMPFYRAEVPARNFMGRVLGKWGGPFKYHVPNEEISEATQHLGLHVHDPSRAINTMPKKVADRLRFLLRDKALGTVKYNPYEGSDKNETILDILKDLSKKYPNDLRVLEFPDTIERFAQYSDPTQIGVPLRKMFEYMKKVK